MFNQSFMETNVTISSPIVFVINCSRTYHYVPLVEPYLTALYIATVFLAIIVLPTVILNSLIIYIISRTKQLQTNSNSLLACTAICDILSAAIGIPCYISAWLLASKQEEYCGLYITAFVSSHITVFLSYLLACAMTMDRYLAIFKPYFYCQHLSHNKELYLKIVGGLTILVAIVVGLNFLTENRLLMEMVACASSPFIFANIYIQIKVHLHVNTVRRKISQQKCVSGASRLHKGIPNVQEPSIIQIDPSSMSQDGILNLDEVKNNLNITKKQKQKTLKKIKKQVNLSYLTLFVTLSLCIAYTPFIIIIVLQQFFHLHKDPNVQIIYMWSYAFLCIKCLLNPAIYCYSSKSLRDKTIYLLKLKQCRGNDCAPA